jgi:hypothetical protein
LTPEGGILISAQYARGKLTGNRSAHLCFGGILVLWSIWRMNVFERAAHETAVKAHGIVTTWACFVAAVDELIDSYNRIPKGIRHPAQIKQRSDATIVVECAPGQAPNDPFSGLILTIRAKMVRERASIDACIAKWEYPPVPGVLPTNKSRQSFNFQLEVDSESDQTWLNCNSQKYDAFSAAEMLLKEALLK